MTTESPKTIHASLRELRAMFENTARKWNLDQVEDAGDSVVVNKITPLGSLNIEKLQEKFIKGIESIRATVNQFETGTFAQLLKDGEPVFRKHITLLKEQSQLEGNVKTVESTLNRCIEMLSEKIQPEEESNSLDLVQVLKTVAHEVGLNTYDLEMESGADSGDSAITYTIAGTEIVIDIGIHPATNIIHKVKVSYASEMQQDERVEYLLAENLRTFNIAAFRTNLSFFATADQFKHDKVKFFRVLRGIGKDFGDIWRQEMASAMERIQEVLTQGHGIPLQNVFHPGCSIAYWASQRQLLAVTDWDQVKRMVDSEDSGIDPSLISSFWRIWIGLEECPGRNTLFLPPSRSQYLVQYDETEESVNENFGDDAPNLTIITEPYVLHVYPSFRFVQVDPNSSITSVPIRFVARLEPPLIVATTIASRIAEMIGIGDNRFGIIGQGIESAQVRRFATMEEFLIAEAIPKNQLDHHRVADFLKPEIQWEMSYPDLSVTQKFSYVGHYLSENPTVVERVPFVHPNQVFGVLQCLRRQLLFNTLFQSCFNTHTWRAPTPSTQNMSFTLDDLLNESLDQAIQIELSLLSPVPSGFHISITHPTESLFLISLEIHISESSPIQFSVKLLNRNLDNYVFDETKMTEVLRIGESLPLLVRWILKRVENFGSGVLEGEKKDIDMDGGDDRGGKRFRFE